MYHTIFFFNFNFSAFFFKFFGFIWQYQCIQSFQQQDSSTSHHLTYKLKYNLLLEIYNERQNGKGTTGLICNYKFLEKQKKQTNKQRHWCKWLQHIHLSWLHWLVIIDVHTLSKNSMEELTLNISDPIHIYLRFFWSSSSSKLQTWLHPWELNLIQIWILLLQQPMENPLSRDVRYVQDTAHVISVTVIFVSRKKKIISPNLCN